MRNSSSTLRKEDLEHHGRTLEHVDLLTARIEVQRQFAGLSDGGSRAHGLSVVASRTFVRASLNAALGKASFNLGFDIPNGRDVPFSAVLATPDVSGIRCPLRNCVRDVQCVADFSTCNLRKDASTCVSCSLRNPLNNRCIRESVDTVCEESRARNNRRHESRWKACLARAEEIRADCRRMAAQAVNEDERRMTIRLERLHHLTP